MSDLPRPSLLSSHMAALLQAEYSLSQKPAEEVSTQPDGLYAILDIPASSACVSVVSCEVTKEAHMNNRLDFIGLCFVVRSLFVWETRLIQFCSIS